MNNSPSNAPAWSGPKSTRIALRAAVCISMLAILGGGTSVALAWVCAMTVHSPSTARFNGYWVDVQTLNAWVVSPRSDQFGSSAWSVNSIGRVEPARPQSWIGVPVPSGLPTTVMERCRAHGGKGFESRATGWPRRCLWGATDGAGMNVDHLAAIEVFGQSPWMSKRGIAGALPVGVLWRGLEIDTAFFAGFWLIALGGPWLARRRIRRRRGRCVGCGYDLRQAIGAGPCPECGRIRIDGPITAKQS